MKKTAFAPGLNIMYKTSRAPLRRLSSSARPAQASLFVIAHHELRRHRTERDLRALRTRHIWRNGGVIGTRGSLFTYENSELER